MRKQSRNIHTFLGCEAEYLDSKIVVFGAPFDSTTSYRPGTRFASATMRKESYGLETYSPYQQEDILDKNIFDGGDLELPFGNVERVLHMIYEYVKELLIDQKLPLMIGGEHLVTLGAVRAVFDVYPDLHIVHFDAHTDLRDRYLDEKLSHATVMRRCYDLVGDGHIHQFGIRSGEKEEFDFAKEHTKLHPFSLEGIEETVDLIGDSPVYLSVDLDVLDPSVFPGTGTPEAGGVSFMELLFALRKLKGLHMIGADINELSPPYDPSGISTATACKVLRELLLIL